MVNRNRTKKTGFFLTFALLFLFLYLLSMTGSAAYKVIDNAELFYSNEKRNIEDLAAQIDENYQMNVLAMTDQNRNGKSVNEKAEAAYEKQGYGDNKAQGGICILIDMANRELTLITDGLMARFITDDREEDILDIGYIYLGAAEYGDAMIAMLERVEHYLDAGIPGGHYQYDPETGSISRYYSLSEMDFGIAFGGALLLPLLITMSVASGYKKIKRYKYDLNTNAELKITGASDRFVNQIVTKRRINTDSSRSGGGSSGGNRTTMHRSSSGRSYGGGHSRKF